VGHLAGGVDPRHHREMDNPTGPEKRRAYQKIAMLAYLRSEGSYTEEQIAERLEFGSPEAMYIQLKNWQLPEWLVGGEETSTSRTPERKARAGESEVIELPPAADAAPFFREVLERLLVDVDALHARMEYLKDKRFVVERDTSKDFFVEEITTRLWRSEYSDEEWRKWCEKRGEDPEAEFVDVPITDLRALRSASPVPPEPLATLIAVYVVSGGDPDKLLDVLQPDQPRASREQLAKIERRLKVEARRYAIGARGGDVKTGQKPGELSSEEHTAAIYIKERREQGATDEQILEELHKVPVYQALSLNLGEVQRLGNLNLPENVLWNALLGRKMLMSYRDKGR
jgi:hypothetical protein